MLMTGADLRIQSQATEAVGMSVEDTEAWSKPGIHGSYLLLQRLALLRIDPARLAQEEPAAFRELQKQCVACTSRDSCIRDLVRDAFNPAGADWKDYCPNIAALNMFSALASFETSTHSRSHEACFGSVGHSATLEPGSALPLPFVGVSRQSVKD